VTAATALASMLDARAARCISGSSMAARSKSNATGRNAQTAVNTLFCTGFHSLIQ